jgi:hypothetical protein
MRDIITVVWGITTFAMCAVLIPCAKHGVELPIWVEIFCLILVIGGFFSCCVYVFWKKDEEQKK